jgi:hypothetical protein
MSADFNGAGIDVAMLSELEQLLRRGETSEKKRLIVTFLAGELFVDC